ncbi:hypothetical protein EJ05DRAFT_537769 [Pseudovirgaria hyperparasitica]|uniref:Uncharacterized protein n=1 Tax=Pseudovirgaria hyperparasitica TaxID=470096 RepID=A0A6A6W6X9_9PEZI|nr:uncharacterized protein EJ05DRAFT_537769 [Pseudovirgaria hyperparasitica]KAF2758383.1 hypothetical protein EJ05DRAFT_537769 [Pseudovirgaria hyperparasitica]
MSPSTRGAVWLTLLTTFTFFTYLTTAYNPSLWPEHYTYGFHESCDPFPYVEDAVDEAIRMADVSGEHFRRILGDQDMNSAFKRVFRARDWLLPRDKYGLRDTTWKIYKIIANMRPYGGRRWWDAHIHIYCDNDKRWELMPDRGEQPELSGEINSDLGQQLSHISKSRAKKYSTSNIEMQIVTPNSKRPIDDQIWEDKMSSVFAIGLPECRDPVFEEEEGGYAAAMYNQVRPAPPYRQVTTVATISVCNAQSAARVATIRELRHAGFFNRHEALIDDMAYLLSFHILHELMRIHPMNRLFNESAQDWGEITKLNATDALSNAANLTFFALLMRMHAVGWVLSRDETRAELGVLTGPNNIERPEWVMRNAPTPPPRPPPRFQRWVDALMRGIGKIGRKGGSSDSGSAWSASSSVRGGDDVDDDPFANPGIAPPAGSSGRHKTPTKDLKGKGKAKEEDDGVDLNLGKKTYNK